MKQIKTLQEVINAPREKDRDEKKSLRLLIFPLALVAQFFYALLPSWLDGTYYDYGLLVPLLFPVFFLQRWRESNSQNAIRKGGWDAVAGAPITWVLGGLTLILVFFLRLVELVDSGWRLPLYLHGAVVLGFCWWLLGRVMGRGAASGFLPCLILVWLSIPLPSRVEHVVIDSLTSGVTEFAVFSNRMLGLPVTRAGETLFVAGQSLQVSEGCSGIRSFQSSMFAGFVLGEFLRLGLGSRIVLFIGSLAAAFVFNSLRVVSLVQYAASHTQAELQKLHDVSGYFSLGLTFLFVFVLARALGLTEERSANRSKKAQEASSNLPREN